MELFPLNSLFFSRRGLDEALTSKKGGTVAEVMVKGASSLQSNGP